MSGVGPARWLRRQFNRMVVVIGALAILPSLALLERGRVGAGRAFAHAGIRLVMTLTGIGLTVRPCGADGVLGPEDAEGAGFRVVVANHDSLLDIPVLMLALPGARFLAAADLYRIPLLASALRPMGCTSIDRKRPGRGRQQIDELVAAGPTGTLVVFPQGAIRGPGRLRFKTGAFELARQTGAAVWPVAIHGTADVLPPGARLAARPGRIEVQFLAPIGPAEAAGLSRRGLRDRAEAAVLGALGEQET